LSSGDTIDFAVGDGGNGFSNDSTGLFATLSVPEPAGLTIFGYLAVAMRIRRRNVASTCSF
jgi:hypothetical protein